MDLKMQFAAASSAGKREEGFTEEAEVKPSPALRLLTPAERHKIMVEWNATTTSYPKNQCIQELFENQARQTPDAVAVVCGEQQLTYRQLNQRSNQLAHLLIKHRV